MRNAFADEITRLALNDEKIVLLSGDIGNRLFNNYKDQIKDRFYNCGIAEANMTTVAAGLALSGLKPVTYTITSFNTSRCYEQIKLDVGYHNLHVVIVGTGSGLSYSNLGSTHHSLDDISLMKSIPNMTIVCPADSVELRLALREAVNYNKPVYIRIGKKNEPIIHQEEPDFKIGKCISVHKGFDICILSTGNIMPVALQVKEMLLSHNISTEIVSFHTIKPLDSLYLEKMMEEKYRLIVTLEEHSLINGLGTSIAEWMIDNNKTSKRLLRMGIPDEFIHKAGNQNNARNKLGLSPVNIVNKIISILKKG